MATVELQSVYKKYEGNDKFSVTDFNLLVQDKELSLFVLLAVVNQHTAMSQDRRYYDGNLIIDDKLVNDLPKR